MRHRCGTVSTGPLSDCPLPCACVRPVRGAHACGQHQLWLFPVGFHLAIRSAVRWIRPVNDALCGVLVEDERDAPVDGAGAVGVAGPPRQSLIARCCPAGSTWLFILPLRCSCRVGLRSPSVAAGRRFKGAHAFCRSVRIRRAPRSGQRRTRRCRRLRRRVVVAGSMRYRLGGLGRSSRALVRV